MIFRQVLVSWISGSLTHMKSDISISHSIIFAIKMVLVIRGDIRHLKKTSSQHNSHLKKRIFDSFRYFRSLGFYSIRVSISRYQQKVLMRYFQSTDRYVDD